MANGARGLVARWPKAFGAVWLALIVGATLAVVYAFWYGPLVILAYWAAPLTIFAVALSVLRDEREGVPVTLGDASVVSVTGWWVVGCAIGGIIGGLGYVAEFVGELILFGGLLGLAQWVVLRQYLRYARSWVVVSFVGWIIAQVLIISIQGAFPGLVEVAHEMTRDDVFAYALFDPFVWTVYGMTQAIVLLAILRRRVLPWILPWVFASATGGVFGAASIYLKLNALLGAWSGGFAAFVSIAIYQGVLCAFYGIPTGLVLYGVLRRSSAAEQGI